MFRLILCHQSLIWRSFRHWQCYFHLKIMKLELPFWITSPCACLSLAISMSSNSSFTIFLVLKMWWWFCIFFPLNPLLTLWLAREQLPQVQMVCLASFHCNITYFCCRRPKKGRRIRLKTEEEELKIVKRMEIQKPLPLLLIMSNKILVEQQAWFS